jgi:hypothetical protein
MIKIDFLDKSKTKGIQGFGVAINNCLDEEAHYHSPYNKRHYVSFSNENAFNEILKYSYEEVGKKFYSIHHNFEIENWDFVLSTTISIHNSKYRDETLFIYVLFDISWEDWNKPYSIWQFAATLNTIIERSNHTCKYYQEDEDFVTNGFGIQFPIEIKNIMDSDVKDALSLTEQILQETKTLLIETIDTDVLTTFFSFPESIKTACKQYLIYFAQFLMDLGIDAETEINEESNKTLFKVIPKNKGESLEKIKIALETYLNAPEIGNLDALNISNDIAVSQWQSNIFHLKSQLMISQSIIQLKDATIQSLQLSNFEYKNLLEAEKSENKGKDEEEIIKGVVSVNKYEGKGFSINIPEIVRRLKRKF